MIDLSFLAESSAPNQWFQVPGAVLLLTAFGLIIFKYVSAESPIYTGLNCAGGSLLAYEAWRTEQLGFLLLEGTWALIATVGLLRWVVQSWGNRSPRAES